MVRVRPRVAESVTDRQSLTTVAVGNVAVGAVATGDVGDRRSVGTGGDRGALLVAVASAT